jgi:hypothetical protein
MPLKNIIVCDACAKEIPIDRENEDASLILQTTDANGEKVFHCGIVCHRVWANKYESPYARPKAAEFIPLDAILSGAREN